MNSKDSHSWGSQNSPVGVRGLVCSSPAVKGTEHQPHEDLVSVPPLKDNPQLQISLHRFSELSSGPPPTRQLGPASPQLACCAPVLSCEIPSRLPYPVLPLLLPLWLLLWPDNSLFPRPWWAPWLRGLLFYWLLTSAQLFCFVLGPPMPSLGDVRQSTGCTEGCCLCIEELNKAA